MTSTTQQRFDRRGLSYVTSGNGPLVVLIHGVGLRADAWCRQIDALSTEFTVMAIDMPGHGTSAVPDTDMTLDDYSDAIASALPEAALIVGHSMGAMIALDMASRFPDRVRGVAALNAIYQRSTAARDAVMARAASLDGQATIDPSAPLDRWFGTALTPEREACRTWLQDIDPAGYEMAYRVFASEDGPSEAQLRSLPCPALFVTGSEEPNSTPAMSRSMAALVPQGRAIVIDDAAHMMPMTHAKHVNTALWEFAREVLQ
ncbi:alpha/beta hydrolase [Sedimentitalea sp. CY04]|uniref:Alpha/beta hydrolase n=1 Tax=Parasedimentitalea denitrificans TaxID=2211118 RepID=A0ABX0W7N7_9RHOB|nr:alpha/beta hydrolase [Sedimentitalea sp. CY04]NIZ61675.1 alpha/beta hydrolase [Sedimentitalea sp. CY04]